MVSFLPVRGVIIIQGTYSSVEELELFGKTWTSNIPRRIIAERFDLSLVNYVLVFSGCCISKFFGNFFLF
jgi:hypothetical protein